MTVPTIASNLYHISASS